MTQDLKNETSPLVSREDTQINVDSEKNPSSAWTLLKVIPAIAMVYAGSAYAIDSTGSIFMDTHSVSPDSISPQRPNNSVFTESYFRCPPGNYLNNTDENFAKKNKRLQAVVEKLLLKGWVTNSREEYKSQYETRGYAVFESPIWPGPSSCATLPDEVWTSENNKWYYEYEPDHCPTGVTKQVFEDYPFEFHVNWKVASTSFSSYLPSEYGSYSKVSEDTDTPDDYLVVSSVRYPLARFVSGVGELMQRSMNHYCPSGYCNSDGDPTNSYDNETMWKLWHQTTWYPLMCNETEMSFNKTGSRWETVPECHFNFDHLAEIVTAFVRDNKCKFYYYAAEHFISQAAFVTQNDGNAHDIDILIRLEDLDNGLDQLAKRLNHTQTESFPDLNSATNKPGGLPSESQIYEILDLIPDLTIDLCWIYAQDFICFEYELPEVCKGLF